MLPAGPEALRRIIRAADMLVQTLGRFAKVCQVDSLREQQPWICLIDFAAEARVLDRNTYSSFSTACGDRGRQRREIGVAVKPWYYSCMSPDVIGVTSKGPFPGVVDHVTILMTPIESGALEGCGWFRQSDVGCFTP